MAGRRRRQMEYTVGRIKGGDREGERRRETEGDVRGGGR